MPLVLGICTVVVTMGLVYLLSMYTTMSVFVTSTVSMFGIALAIDYSLFILMRFREELRAGRDPAQAADAAMATSGLAVVLSGLTVIASVTGIYLINTPVLVVDGHRRDPGRRGRGADVDHADPGGAGDVRQGRGQTLVAACTGRGAPETTQSRFWTRWTGWVMRRPWLSALGGVRVAAHAGRAGVRDDARQQHAAAVRTDPRDPRRRQRGGRGAGPRCARPGAGAGDVPRRQRRLRTRKDAARWTRCARGWRRRPNVVSVSPPVFGDDNRSALLSAVLSVDPEDMAARDTVDWMRATAAASAGGGHARRRRRRADRADQGLRRSGVGHPAAGVRVRRADRVRDAADLDPVGVPGAQGRPDDRAVGGRRLRQPGRRLPVGLAGGAGLQTDLDRSTARSRRWCWR